MVNSRDDWEEQTQWWYESFFINILNDIIMENKDQTQWWDEYVKDDEAPHEGLEEIRKHEECID